MELVDLHTHTTASDGTLTPAQLVAEAEARGLAAVAITDHDTVDGVAPACDAAAHARVEVVPGVEISVEGGPRGSMHILGLLIDHTHPELTRGLSRMKQARANRNPKIIDKLNHLGIPVTLEEVAAISGGGQVGRPHFAQALWDRGVVGSKQEAFSRYLGAGKKAYVAKQRFSYQDGIALIRAAGGLPVLAHPGLLKLGMAEMEKLLKTLMDCGLMGLEAYYGEHDPALAKRLAALAGRLGLSVSGGTDFHGGNKPAIKLAVGRGQLRVPVEILTGLKNRLGQMAKNGAKA